MYLIHAENCEQKKYIPLYVRLFSMKIRKNELNEKHSIMSTKA